MVLEQKNEQRTKSRWNQTEARYRLQETITTNQGAITGAAVGAGVRKVAIEATKPWELGGSQQVLEAAHAVLDRVVASAQVAVPHIKGQELLKQPGHQVTTNHHRRRVPHRRAPHAVPAWHGTPPLSEDPQRARGGACL